MMVFLVEKDSGRIENRLSAITVELGQFIHKPLALPVLGLTGEPALS